MLGDSEIMQSTYVDGDTVSYTLPDGQVMKGPKPVSAAQISGWCDAVRSNIEAVMAHQRARKRSPTEGVTDQGTRAEPAKAAVDPQDPVAYAEANLAQWQQRREQLAEQIADLRDQYQVADANMAKWQKVKEALAS